MPDNERQNEVLSILRNLRDLDGLKKLFWQELNYERENRPLSPRRWPESARQPLAEDPILFASGGEDNAFHVVYCRLESDALLRGHERPIVNRLTREHPYALFVFSNKTRSDWHFLNVKYDEDAEKRRLLRRITVRLGEGLRTAAERLPMLDLEAIGPDLFGLSPLAIQQRHDDAFDERRIADMLDGFAPGKTRNKDSVFYRAILQNLFFATLNTEMEQRGWRRADQNFMAHSLYRHKECFRDPKAVQEWFKDIPFLNGGLFECLDRDFGLPAEASAKEGEGTKPRYLRVDGFSDRADSRPTVPDFLFFGPEREVDLSEEYGTKKFRNVRVRGLIDTLNRYKFTIEENTPFDQEVALDPELCGKVFENLLAAYNPETGTTARKATGSFYTPREIVDYMVDESLVAYLKGKLEPRMDANGRESGGTPAPASARKDREAAVPPETAARIRALLAYDGEPPEFNEAETETLIDAIDGLKALDPAVGSGAFPMGILHKLVHVLGKLDPDNERWKTKQIAKLDDAVMREEAEQLFRENYDDYGRKLYLIENCIYGVDIQPIAVQIAKMRFFISLIVDQKVNPKASNLGVRALPNLETKFVAANTLIGIERPTQMMLRNPEIDKKEEKLRKVREKHFTAKTLKAKAKCRDDDKRLRAEIAALLKNDGWDDATARQLAAWNPYDQNASAAFFDPEWMFGVMEGFDVAIGNPPYGRILSAEQEERLSQMRPAFRSTKDAYVAFMLSGFDLINEKGVECYIVPSAWLGDPSYTSLRADVLHNTISQIIALPFDMFAAAYVDNVVFLAIKGRPVDGHTAQAFTYPKRANINEFLPGPREEISQADWGCMPNQKIVLSNAGLRLHRNLQSHCRKSLADAVEMRRGVLFDKRILTERKSGANSFRYFEGDVYRYEIRTAMPRWVELGGKMKEYPKEDKWFKGERILLRRLVNRRQRLMATLVRDDFVTNKNLYSILHNGTGPNLRCVLAVINSTLLSRLYIDAVSQAVKDDFPQVTITDCLALPLPSSISATDESALVRLVDRILAAKKADPAADTSAWEREIDERVYRLYGLTADEIKIVESNAKGGGS